MGSVFECSGYNVVKSDIVRGQDCYLYDTADNRYVDFEAGVWCTSVGHNHPRVNGVMTAQMQAIAHLGYRYTNPIVEEAAAKILDTVELYAGKCIFLSSGSEAVEFAVQIARRLSEQPLFITLADSYLAAYGEAGNKGRAGWFSFDWSVCNHCPHLTCGPQCDHWRRIPVEQIAGLVLEPGNTGGLVKLPPHKLVQALQDLVKRRDGIIVVDEVTTGLGRTGEWYGFQHYALQPDIIAIGKGLGNGYPVSAVAMTGNIASRLEKRRFRYAQSHQNDALAAAVAKEVIRIIEEEKLIARSSVVGTKFLTELKRLAARYNYIREVRGRGLMLAIEFYQDSGQFSLAAVHKALCDNGFLVGCKPEANLLRFYPALTIKEQDITRMLEVLEQILEQTM